MFNKLHITDSDLFIKHHVHVCDPFFEHSSHIQASRSLSGDNYRATKGATLLTQNSPQSLRHFVTSTTTFDLIVELKVNCYVIEAKSLPGLKIFQLLWKTVRRRGRRGFVARRDTPRIHLIDRPEGLDQRNVNAAPVPTALPTLITKAVRISANGTGIEVSKFAKGKIAYRRNEL